MIHYPNRVLLASDGSEDSARAAQLAVSLSVQAGSELHVVHVGQLTPSSTGATAQSAALPSEPPGGSERRAGRLLARQAEQVERSGGAVTETHLRMGNPAQEVIRLSEELEADLLVVGSGRPRPIRRAGAATVRRPILGRASDAIARSARCPVLIAHRDALPSATGETAATGGP